MVQVQRDTRVQRLSSLTCVFDVWEGNNCDVIGECKGPVASVHLDAAGADTGTAGEQARRAEHESKVARLA